MCQVLMLMKKSHIYCVMKLAINEIPHIDTQYDTMEI